MNSCTDQLEIPVQLSGCVASEIMKEATEGQVAAVFRSTFYVETDAGFLCIGNEALEPSPLSLVTTAPAGTDWSACGLQRNAQVHISSKAISVGNRFSYLHSGAADWSPTPVPNHWCAIDLERGLNVFREASLSYIPEEGLGPFLINGHSPSENNLICVTAQAPIAEAQRWLVSAMRCPDRGEQVINWVHPLVGLGPGLTPSGDDVIGGVMIALHGVGKPGICRHLWKQAHDQARSASNPISHALLNAASQGYGSAGIHCALAAILQGREQDIRDSVAGIDRIGHTSGWDTMTGAAIAFDAWLQAHRH
jgi:hypothetical protein